MKVRIKKKDLINLLLSKADAASDLSTGNLIGQHYCDLAADLQYFIPDDEFVINAIPNKNPKTNYFPKK